jgi:hypothetical protein
VAGIWFVSIIFWTLAKMNLNSLTMHILSGLLWAQSDNRAFPWYGAQRAPLDG